MRDTYATRIILICSILALTVLLTVTGIRSMIELWSDSLSGSNWFFPFVLTPLVAGICAVVCYLFYAVIAEMFIPRHTDRHHKLH